MEVYFWWGQGFARDFDQNKKTFWKEVRKGGSRNEEIVKDDNGRLMTGNKARKYFEHLLNVEDDREADVVAIGGAEILVFSDKNGREVTKRKKLLRGMDVREAKEHAMDRNDWRAIVRQF